MREEIASNVWLGDVAACISTLSLKQSVLFGFANSFAPSREAVLTVANDTIDEHAMLAMGLGRVKTRFDHATQVVEYILF
ncbi:MAG: hypothetical protein CBC34_004460 [Hyphomicrobiaceae bacterium TMED74]|nr:hypothetical protein [Filomicrobium sp.]RPG45634.1 MAG: hypothetical protein CBC34_004460 [Hyphomicrobiaceae bacterium TMED74]